MNTLIKCTMILDSTDFSPPGTTSVIYCKCPNIFQNLSLRSFRRTIKIILNATGALLTW